MHRYICIYTYIYNVFITIFINTFINIYINTFINVFINCLCIGNNILNYLAFKEKLNQQKYAGIRQIFKTDLNCGKWTKKDLQSAHIKIETLLNKSANKYTTSTKQIVISLIADIAHFETIN